MTIEASRFYILNGAQYVVKRIHIRIALGMLAHEANTFSPHATDLSDFGAGELARGAELLANWEGKNTAIAGAMGVFSQVPGCEVVPLLAARAMSGGPVREDAFRALLGELVERLSEAMPVNGVLLVLHGAMMSEDEPDATGEILRGVRALVGDLVPLVGTLDLHANVTERMVQQASALIGYHTAPHVDMLETGARGARLLVDTVRGAVSPTMAVTRLPMILAPENSTHNWPPLGDVIAMAVEWEDDGSILHAGVYPVQPWMDTADVASSVVVITDGDQEEAQRRADALGREFWGRRAAFVSDLVSPEEAVHQALAHGSGTVVFCDSADSTTSGSTGDSTAILQALLEAAPREEVALLNVVDPEAVQKAIHAGIGSEVTLEVGGKLAPEHFAPVSYSGTIETISDGSFTFKGPGMRGVTHRMGRTVVIIRGGIHLVVMERAVSQWDPQLYRSLGEEPADARIVQVKSPMAFRAAYKGICDKVVIIKVPGAANPDLRSLPWQHVRRPIYPLHADVTWP